MFYRFILRAYMIKKTFRPLPPFVLIKKGKSIGLPALYILNKGGASGG
jgi:hypothetical protein